MCKNGIVRHLIEYPDRTDFRHVRHNFILFIYLVSQIFFVYNKISLKTDCVYTYFTICLY